MRRSALAAGFATTLLALVTTHAHAAPPTPSPDPPTEESEAESPQTPVKVVPVQRPDGTVVLVPLAQMQPSAPQVVVVATPHQERPAVMPYVEGAPIPDGYVRDEKPITGLVIAGPIVLGVGWMMSALAGVFMAADRLGDDDGFIPMTIPVVGGLITIGTAKEKNREGAAIGGVMSFIVQSAGTGMLIGGLAGKRDILRRVGLEPTLEVGVQATTLGLRGSF